MHTFLSKRSFKTWWIAARVPFKSFEREFSGKKGRKCKQTKSEREIRAKIFSLRKTHRNLAKCSEKSAFCNYNCVYYSLETGTTRRMNILPTQRIPWPRFLVKNRGVMRGQLYVVVGFKWLLLSFLDCTCYIITNCLSRWR